MYSENCIAMSYGCTDRDEDVGPGERSVQEAQHITKKGLFTRNAQEWWCEEFLDNGVKLLNRFALKSCMAHVAPDGDQSRPLEDFTNGFYSGQQINRELAYHVMPCTPVAVHDPEQLGSAIESKTDWCIAIGMLREQLIVGCI